MKNNKQRKPRILIYFPHLTRSKKLVIGGAEFRILQAIQLLKDKCEISLVLKFIPDWVIINRAYATSIEEKDIGIILIGNQLVPFQVFLNNCGRRFDLCISGHNIEDFNAPGLHFITNCFFDNKFTDYIKDRGILFDDVYKPEVGRIDKLKTYLSFARYGRAVSRRLSRLVAPSRTIDQIVKSPNERIISNSEWIADAVAECYGVEKLEVLNPPVVTVFPEIPWEERTNGFVCIGRISPEKKIENIISILDQVRSKVQSDIHLHLGGKVPDNDYGKMISSMLRDRAWIKVYGDIFGQEKAKLVASQRFAIHGCTFEGFGISVAEYVKAGTVPIVPNSGGGAEIIPFNDLHYGSNEEAVEKISTLLDDYDRQLSYHHELMIKGKAYSLENFQTSFINIIYNELEKRGFYLS